ncbi:RHS repeat-associated core domain-containing protein [Chryseobacterium taichungense]|uniref:RHS repeat-associated core domain-containing protein n=1 Tax=Chryseobacterium taichungense TaxID=295069 RepID=A0A1H8DWD0_9FLAO|nr:RHS repeat-associated core domain-containing protein [Chryseobacterium taichungense]SEN11572.1 RHS repeat-associated core domain-containing protein [Chryseobacterium taichungense]
MQEFGAYDFGARIYMADIARWFATDPMAEANPGLSVYRYGFNNPIMFTDPNGMLEQAQINHIWNNSGNNGITSWSFNKDGSPKRDSYNPMEDSEVNNLLAAFNNVALGGGSSKISFFTGTATQTSYKIGNDLYGVGNLGQGHTILLKNSNENEKINLDGYISIIGNLNDFFDSSGKSLATNSGIIRLGTNGRIYFPTVNGRVFYGNQYVRTMSLARYGTRIGKVVGPFGNVVNGAKIINGIYKDDWTYGHKAQVATAGVAGSMAGTWAGAEFGSWAGAKIGAGIGVWVEGWGAVPGAAIGGIVGGLVGGFFGGMYGGDYAEQQAENWLK